MSSSSTYLKETVGPRLRLALASMLIKQPADCVDFIGRFLLYEEPASPAPKQENQEVPNQVPAVVEKAEEEDWLTECKRLTGASEVYVALKENECWYFVEGDQTGSQTEGVLCASEFPISIDNVLRDDRVNFFGKMPQFGSFAAYPMTSVYGEEMVLCANTLGSSNRILLDELEKFAQRDFLPSVETEFTIFSGELNQLRELAARGPIPPRSAQKLAASLYSAYPYWPHIAKSLASFDETTFAQDFMTLPSREEHKARIKEALSQYEKDENYCACELFDTLHAFLTELVDREQQQQDE